MDKKEKAEYMRRWRAKHPEWAGYMRQYREVHQEKIAADSRAWKQNNRERNAELAKNWYHANHLLGTCIAKAATANKRFPGRVTPHQILDLIERSGRKCHWCGKENLIGRDLTLEHLRSVNDLQYLTISCQSCNSAQLHKSSKLGPKTKEDKRRENYARSYKWFLDNKARLHAIQADYRQRKTLRKSGGDVVDTPKIAARKWGEANQELRTPGLTMGQYIYTRVKAANSRYPGTITMPDLRSIIDRSGKKCCHCGKEGLRGDDLTLEHLQPVNDPQHLAISCRACNSERHHLKAGSASGA